MAVSKRWELTADFYEPPCRDNRGPAPRPILDARRGTHAHSHTQTQSNGHRHHGRSAPN